jgi:hypothetical protein
MKAKVLVSIVIVLILSVAMLNVAAAAPAQPVPTAQEPAVALTPEVLAAVLGVVLSLAASYVPRFRTWWAALLDDYKRLIMALANILIGVVIYALACSPNTGFPFVVCPTGGFWYLVQVILLALIANQTTDRVSPDTNDVKEIKAAQKAPLSASGS